MNLRILPGLFLGCLGALAAEEGKLDIPLAGKPFTSFYWGADWDKPFLHPLRTAAGTVITRQYPLVKDVPGERQDHPWHRGIWFGHGDINGVDFWREKVKGKMGRIIAKAPPQLKRQGNAAVLAGDFELVYPEDKTVLGSQREELRFFQQDGNNYIDAHMTIFADKGVALKLGDTEEGTFGLRLADEFREDHGATLLNSDGLTGSAKIWGKRAKWVDYTSTIAGQKCGVAIFDHPSNPKHPTYWHARNYGLNAANPFGEHDFYKDKSRDGSMTIPAGGKLEFRYRVVIHPGDAAEAQVEKLYQHFAGK
jgi:Methane oxygenase PmoA